MQRDLNKAYTWSQTSEMTWNVHKFSTPQPIEDKLALAIGNESTRIGRSEKYLRVTLTIE